MQRETAAGSPEVASLGVACPLRIQRSCACGGACAGCAQRDEDEQALRLQPKLTVGAPDDPAEQEADRVADMVMRMAEPGIGAPAAQGIGALQRAQPPAADAAAGNEAPPIVDTVLRAPGQPLDAATRAFMEPRFGRDFGQVRLHTDAQAAESARAVNALAYTVGRDLVFGAGQYAPETDAGRRLMAHELAHVAQTGADHLTRTTLRRTAESDAARIESLLSYGVLDWEITDKEAIEALDILSNLSPNMQQAVLRRINIGRLRENLPKAYVPNLEELLAKVGEPPRDVRATVERIQDLLSYGLFDWAITDHDATEALKLLLSLPPDEQKRVVLAINYRRLYDNLPSKEQKAQLQSIHAPASAQEQTDETMMEAYRARARKIIDQIKVSASSLTLPAPPSGGAFETWISKTYLSKYCSKPSSEAASIAIDEMSKLGAGGFTHYGFGLLRDLADKAIDDGIGYIDSPYLLGTPNPGSVSTTGFFDPWSQGPNPTQMMHFASGIKWSWAPTFLVQWYFVHYEKVTEEGWQIFGLDSLNDIIAEEGARLFAEDLKRSSVSCSGGVADLDSYFRRGRVFLKSQLSESELERLALRVHQPHLVVAVDAQGRQVESRPLWDKTIMEQIMAGASDAGVLVSPDAKILTILYHLMLRG